MEGERKQVTVLFADLKGNTELIRDLDPEAGQLLLDTALQCMMDAVHRFEGTVNDVAGDGLMAMFGAPIAHEDHALIEQRYADRLADQVARLAHHALRGEMWDKALAYFRQAGDKALARSASREAVACFEQALVALAHLPEGRERHEQSIDVRFGLRHALSPRLEFGRLLTYLREAEVLAQALSDQHRLGWGAAYMIDCFGATGDLQPIFPQVLFP